MKAKFLVWLAALLLSLAGDLVHSPLCSGEEVEQLYNMSFDDWSMSSNAWLPYSEQASAKEKTTWSSSNIISAASLKRNNTLPEDVKVGSSGKAAKLMSQYMVIKFAAGNLFTGEIHGAVKHNHIVVDMAWGVPYSDRPSSLRGLYCYQPVPIDCVDALHRDMKGKMDMGQIQVFLADWDVDNVWDGYEPGTIDSQGRFHVRSSSPQRIDVEHDPSVIGYGTFEFSDWMDSYEEFEIPIRYRSDRTPKVIAIVCTSSKYGDSFTGGAGTVLYLDDFFLRK